LAVIPAVSRAHVPLHFNPRFGHPAVRQLLKLSAWTFGYVAANQIAIVVVQNLAQPGSGQLDAYSKAYIFFVLPHGLLAMSIVTTFTPEMSRAVARKDKHGVHRADVDGHPPRRARHRSRPRPACSCCAARSSGMALEHGNFDAADAMRTSRALAGFALGLVGFSVYLFVLRAFYSHTDARTPFVINLFENLINIAMAFVLVGRFGVLGLGAAFAIAYMVSAAWAMQVLSYKVPGFPLRPVFASLLKMGLASVVMMEVMWAVAHVVGTNVGVGALIRVLAAGITGLAAYVAVLTLLGVHELTQLWGRISSRFA
jgi:putative peptidoglycan lipid II flippase